ncbi:MAG TPA: flagellar hook-basal body complex protein FliE [Solirubrobacteraceae bacterium]|jgi:flagellar hook-basal body complex protein FliE
MPIDPSFALSGAEWQIPGVGGPSGPQPAAGEQPGGGFGSMLGKSIESLTATQNEAASASQALATGSVSDPTQVVMAVERARLSMQLASQIRTKGVEAVQDVFHTQV